MAVKYSKAEKKVMYNQLMGKNTMMKRTIRLHAEKTGNKAFLNLIPLLVAWVIKQDREDWIQSMNYGV